MFLPHAVKIIDNTAEIQAVEAKQIQTEQELDAAKTNVTKLENDLEECKSNVEKLKGSIAALSGASSSNADDKKTDYYCHGIPLFFSKGTLEHFKILKVVSKGFSECNLQLMTLVVPGSYDRYYVNQFDGDDVDLGTSNVYWSNEVKGNEPGKKFQMEIFVKDGAKRIEFMYGLSRSGSPDTFR